MSHEDVVPEVWLLHGVLFAWCIDGVPASVFQRWQCYHAVDGPLFGCLPLVLVPFKQFSIDQSRSTTCGHLHRHRIGLEVGLRVGGGARVNRRAGGSYTQRPGYLTCI